MNSGTVNVSAQDSTVLGPSAFQARIGNPTPANPGQIQYADSSGTSWFDALKEATKQAIKASIGVPGAGVTAKTAEGLTEAAKAAGAGIKAAATSATSGIKWGFAILVVLVVLFVAAPYVNLIPRRN